MLKAAAISAQALADVLNQSVDCVKLLDLSGNVLWMNGNGICAMEIDEVSLIYGKAWPSLWPEESRNLIGDALATAQRGETTRFDAFCPTAKGSPRWWSVTVSAVHSPEGEDIGFLAISRDITDTETQRRTLAIAADELRHRLKNTYAMVCGLLSSLASGNPQNELFAREMNSRLMALSTSQWLFSSSDVPRDAAELVPALVQPFMRPGCTVITKGLKPITVARPEGDAIALVIGELAMNSSKHGALANGGTITITSELHEGMMTMVWDEMSSVPVAAQSRPEGHGLTLIRLMVEAHRGQMDIEWGSHGPVVRFSLVAAA